MAAAYEGCEHYKRKVQLHCSKCKDTNTFWPCRFCHDAVCDEQWILSGKDPKLAHTLNRKEVEKVKCMACGLTQAPKHDCSGCGIRLGAYYCEVCKLYDDVDKGQFHCGGCGICRVGGRDNFFHCVTCTACLPNVQKGNHACIPNALDANCPICMEGMHASRKSSSKLACGHFLHSECMDAYAKTNYRCPFCQKSLGDMTRQWQNLDVEIAFTPMPEEYRKEWVRVLCNDCGQESDTPLHVVALKCRARKKGALPPATDASGAPVGAWAGPSMPGAAESPYWAAVWPADVCGSYNTAKVGLAREAHEPLPDPPAAILRAENAFARAMGMVTGGRGGRAAQGPPAPGAQAGTAGANAEGGQEEDAGAEEDDDMGDDEDDAEFGDGDEVDDDEDFDDEGDDFGDDGDGLGGADEGTLRGLLAQMINDDAPDGGPDAAALLAAMPPDLAGTMRQVMAALGLQAPPPEGAAAPAATDAAAAGDDAGEALGQGSEEEGARR